MISMMTNAIRTIHLQSIGLYPALPASELQVGDVTVWNWGGRETITKIEQASKCFIAVTITNKEGKEFTRRLKRDRLVACERAMEQYKAQRAAKS